MITVRADTFNNEWEHISGIVSFVHEKSKLASDGMRVVLYIATTLELEMHTVSLHQRWCVLQGIVKAIHGTNAKGATEGELFA